jgi:hypothetical protein
LGTCNKSLVYKKNAFAVIQQHLGRETQIIKVYKIGCRRATVVVAVAAAAVVVDYDVELFCCCCCC